MTHVLRLAAAVVMLAVLALPAAAGWIETPSLEADVAAGKLPPVAERLPAEPRVVDLPALGRSLGRHGGTIRTLMGSAKDIRFMVSYGYARLVGYTETLELVPDILKAVEVEGERVFTFHLRPGHKWSDGHPLTAEDFRYAFEDVLTNEELYPGGLSNKMLVDGQPPRFEVVDALTVRYTWAAPNPDFLPAVAAPSPLFLAMPAHYLKQFHAKYLGEEAADALAKSMKVRNWRSLHIRQARQARPENPELPTLDPWLNTVAPPAEQFVFVRNPYFHRVDTEGRQLPYVDRVVMNISSSSLIPAKTGAGESDLQGRYVLFDDYTFLKEAEKRQDIKVRLWQSGQGSKITIQPNLNFEDPGWRAVLHDARFRRALSLGVHRHEINQVSFYGLGREVADSPLPSSPLYREAYATAWASYDPDHANRLLDEMGLDKRDRDGVRLLPDGRRAELIVETAGESTGETDVMELVSDHWRALGLRTFVRSSQRDVFRSRIIAGQTMIGVWSGLDNAIPTADMAPDGLAPTNDAQLMWPQWGLHELSGGAKGSAPDLAPVRELSRLLQQWRRSVDDAERERIWHEMLAIYTDNVFSIGTVNGTYQPIVARRSLRNIPDEAINCYEPCSYFGIYMMDTFWYDEPGS